MKRSGKVKVRLGRTGVYAAVGAAGVVGISDFLLKRIKKKWFIRGYDAGEFVGGLTSTEGLAKKHTALMDKYNKLCEEYEELEREYGKLCADKD